MGSMGGSPRLQSRPLSCHPVLAIPSLSPIPHPVHPPTPAPCTRNPPSLFWLQAMPLSCPPAPPQCHRSDGLGRRGTKGSRRRKKRREGRRDGDDSKCLRPNCGRSIHSPGQDGECVNERTTGTGSVAAFPKRASRLALQPCPPRSEPPRPAPGRPGVVRGHRPRS